MWTNWICVRQLCNRQQNQSRNSISNRLQNKDDWLHNEVDAYKPTHTNEGIDSINAHKYACIRLKEPLGLTDNKCNNNNNNAAATTNQATLQDSDHHHNRYRWRINDRWGQMSHALDDQLCKIYACVLV